MTTYTTAEAAIVAAALAVAVEQQVAAGCIPMPGDPKRFVAFGEMSELRSLVRPEIEATDADIDRLRTAYASNPTAENRQAIADAYWPRAATPTQPIAVSAPTDERAVMMREWLGKLEDEALTDTGPQVFTKVRTFMQSSGYLAARAAAPSEPTGWLVVDSLLYRLNEFGVNCDEINVTMANGSRKEAPRAECAKQLLAMFAARAAAPVSGPTHS